MEIFAVIIGFFFIATFFMPWINSSRIKKLNADVERLQKYIRRLELKATGTAPPPEDYETYTPQQSRTTPSNIDYTPLSDEELDDYLPKEVSKKDMVGLNSDDDFLDDYDTPAPSKTSQSASVPLTSSGPESGNDWVKTAQDSFEKNIATKLPVWIGAISLICAAIFLVKYSIELGWLQPSVRVSLGGLFGIALLAAGQWVIKRPHLANGERISQALVGAGLVALYVSIYAALHLYGLLTPTLGFAAMAMVTALAVILSLKHGQPIAVFGLLGGLVTPALIGSDEPNAIAMFAYLFLLFAGMFTVLVQKGWWMLAIAAVIGVFCWSGFWFLMVFAPADAIVLVVFAIAITAVVLAVTGKSVMENNLSAEQQRPIHGLNFAAILGGVITIGWLSLEISLTLFDWSMLGLLSAALMTLAYFQPAIYQRPLWVKLGATLLLFYAWAGDAPLTDATAVLVGLAAIYIGGAAYLMRKVSDPRFWAELQAVSVIALYLIAYLTFDLSEAFMNSFGMFWGITSLILAGLAILQAADIKKKYTADATIQTYLVATFALLASALISTGLAIELPWSYLPLAIAAQAMVTALIFQRTNINALKSITALLTIIFAALHFDQIVMFTDLALMSLEGRPLYTTTANAQALDAPFVKIGIPAIFLFATFWIFRNTYNKNTRLDHIIFGTALTCATITAYYLFRFLPHGDYALALTTSTTFIERGIITIALGGIGFALLKGFEKFELNHLKNWAVGLMVLAALRYTYFDLLIENPYWNGDQNVGTMPLFNGVTLVYGTAMLAAAWAVCSDKITNHKTVFKTLGFISLFAFSSLTVRQYFHGADLENGTMIPMELYGYSLAWLITGLALLTLGIVKENKTARMGSLGFIVLAVLKVFLLDAAELEGLYRVFSFLGLGLSLIGLSYFYSKFVFDKKI